MAQQKVSVFAKLQENFRRLYDHLKCQDCKRKIDLQTICANCNAAFCTECLFQSKREKKCKSCKMTDSMQPIKDRNYFVNDLLSLIQMFDNDTGLNIIKDDFFNVETAENLERVFDKEKTNALQVQQKFIATSTPNINNAKKVVFNSDITMIPQNAKDAANKQVESVEKVNTKKKPSEKSTTKRKADSSLEDQSESSRSKKAKLANTAAVEESPKTNANEVEEMEEDKQPVEKSLSPRKNSKSQKKEIKELRQVAKENSQPQLETEDQGYEEHARLFEGMREQCEEKMQKIENKCTELENQLSSLEAKNKQIQNEKEQLETKNKQILTEKEQLETKNNQVLIEKEKLDAKNKQIEIEKEKLEAKSKQIENEKEKLEERNKQNEIKTGQLTETIRKLEEKIKLLEAKKDLEEKAIQIIKNQMKEQMSDVNQLVKDAMKKINSTVSAERLQEMNIVSLAKIVSNTENAIKSSIEFDKVGKINFIIEPFSQVEKAKNFEVQNNKMKKSTAQIYVQTETAKLASQSSDLDMNDADNDMKKSQSSVDSEVRRVVNNVVDESLENDKQDNEGSNEKLSNQTNGNKSNGHLSIQFDDDSMKESRESVPKKSESEEKINSDELKKHVEDVSIFDDSEDEIGASSPIYE